MTKDIAFICDDNYCMPTAVCIQSIMDNYALQELLTIHVCTFGLSEHNIEKLNGMNSRYVNTVVDVFDAAGYKEKLKAVSQKSHVTPTALIKFELPSYFQDLDSILYMDSDIVVKADISELLQIEIGDYYIGASYEFFYYLNRVRYTLKRGMGEVFYFNSGVMLLNLKKMRDDDITSKLWDYKLNKARTRLMDQESLNAICATNTKHLPIKWNFNPVFNDQQYVRHINKVYGTNYNDIQELGKDVCIIHYVGAMDKPWKFENARMRQYWERSFKRTPFYSNLELAKAPSQSRPLQQALQGRLKEQGLWGTICYMIYCVENKVKK